MRDKRFQLGSSPHLSFHACLGHLRIQSWDLEEVQLLFRREDEAANVQEEAGGLTIASAMPEAVNVPRGASVLLQHCVGDVQAANLAALHVEQHQGDLSLHHVNRIELTTVHGDVEARETQSLQVTTLHGDLRMRAIDESLAIALVHGDISLKGAKGQLALHDITGDVVIRDPEGHLDVRNVTGDVALSGTLQTGDYYLEALGDIALYLHPASDVHLGLEAHLGHIACGLALNESTESAHELSGKMAQGTAQVRVVTHSGDVRLRPLGADQVRHEMEKERIWTERHAHRLAEHAQRMAEKARRASERWAERAEERAARTRRWQVKWDVPQRKPSPETLEDERLAILKMLAEGKINAEQAESLLKVLEG